MNPTLLKITGTLVLLLPLTACQGTGHHTVSPGVVRGQDEGQLQTGQSEQIKMTREQAEALVNQNKSQRIGSNTEVAGKPDPATQQGAMPPGVGYDNRPGVLYDPSTGVMHYGPNTVHHVVHHVHYTHGGSADPSGYNRGDFETPDNENPNARGGFAYGGVARGGGGLGPQSHTYNGNVVQHHYYGGGGTGVPGGFYGGGWGQGWRGGATLWGNHIGQFHPYAANGAGRTEGFTD